MKAQIEAYNDIIHKVSVLYKDLDLARYENHKGRKLALTIDVIISLGVFKHTHGIETKKAVYQIFQPNCSYKTFVVNLNRFAPLASIILSFMLYLNKKHCHVVKHTDSTNIPVCQFRNANTHKTMKELASFGGTSRGVFYGIRLHLTTDLNRNFLALKFVTAKVDERDVFPELNEGLRGIFVADSGYLGLDFKDRCMIQGIALCW